MAINVGDLYATLGLRTQGLENGARRARNELGSLDNSMRSTLATAAKLSAGMAAVGAATSAILKPIIETAAAFEQLEIALTTIQGSSKKAQKSMLWIREFTKDTPFQLEEVADGFKRLEAYGFKASDKLKFLGDTAAAMGTSLGQAVEMFADATTGEFERLKAFGVRARVEGDKVTLSWMENGKQIEETMNKTQKGIAEGLEKAFARFDGATIAQTQTWAGMVSNMKDQWTEFLLLIADSGSFQQLKADLKYLLDVTTKMGQDGTLESWATKINFAIMSVVHTFKIMGNAVGAVVNQVLGVVMGLEGYIAQLTASVSKLISKIPTFNMGSIWKRDSGEDTLKKNIQDFANDVQTVADRLFAGAAEKLNASAENTEDVFNNIFKTYDDFSQAMAGKISKGFRQIKEGSDGLANNLGKGNKEAEKLEKTVTKVNGALKKQLDIFDMTDMERGYYELGLTVNEMLEAGFNSDRVYEFAKAQDLIIQKEAILAANRGKPEYKDFWQRQAEDIDEVKKRSTDLLYLSDEIVSETIETTREVENIWTKTAQSMENAFSNFFFDAFKGQLRDLSDYLTSFTDQILSYLSQRFAQAAAAMVMTGQGSFGNIFGGGPVGTAGGINPGAMTGGNPLDSLNNFGSFGASSTWTNIGQAYFGVEQVPGQISAPSGWASIGNALGGAAAGAFIGNISQSMLWSNFGFGQGQHSGTGSMLGGAAGGAGMALGGSTLAAMSGLGFLGGPIGIGLGAVLGSGLGSALGGLFGGKPETPRVEWIVQGNVAYNADGGLTGLGADELSLGFKDAPGEIKDKFRDEVEPVLEAILGQITGTFEGLFNAMDDIVTSETKNKFKSALQSIGTFELNLDSNRFNAESDIVIQDLITQLQSDVGGSLYQAYLPALQIIADEFGITLTDYAGFIGDDLKAMLEDGLDSSEMTKIAEAFGENFADGLAGMDTDELEQAFMEALGGAVTENLEKLTDVLELDSMGLDLLGRLDPQAAAYEQLDRILSQFNVSTDEFMNNFNSIEQQLLEIASLPAAERLREFTTLAEAFGMTIEEFLQTVDIVLDLADEIGSVNNSLMGSIDNPGYYTTTTTPGSVIAAPSVSQSDTLTLETLNAFRYELDSIVNGMDNNKTLDYLAAQIGQTGDRIRSNIDYLNDIFASASIENIETWAEAAGVSSEELLSIYKEINTTINAISEEAENAALALEEEAEAMQVAADSIKKRLEALQFSGSGLELSMGQIAGNYGLQIKDVVNSMDYLLAAIAGASPEQLDAWGTAVDDILTFAEVAQQAGDTINSASQSILNSIDRALADSDTDYYLNVATDIYNNGFSSLQDILDFQDAAGGWFQSSLSEITSQVSELNAEISALESFVDTISSKMLSLKYSEYNRALPVLKAEQAGGDYELLKNSAFGSLEDAQKYVDFIDTYLSTMQDAYKSSDTYVNAYEDVQATLDALEMDFGEDLSLTSSESEDTKKSMIEALRETYNNVYKPILTSAMDSLYGPSGRAGTKLTSIDANERASRYYLQTQTSMLSSMISQLVTLVGLTSQILQASREPAPVRVYLDGRAIAAAVSRYEGLNA